MNLPRRIPPALLWLTGYGVFFGLLFWLVLFEDHIFIHKDIRTYTYPLVTLVKQRLWTGEVFWNNLNGFGFPSFLTDGYVWNPLLTFFLGFLSAFQASHWAMALSLIFGAWFCMKVLEEWGFSAPASFVTGLVYGTSLWPWLYNPSTALVILALPLLVLLIIKNSIPPLFRYPGGIVVLSILLLSGFPHYVFIALLALGIVVAVSAIHEGGRWRSPIAKRFCVILVAGGTIGLLRFIPLLAYSLLSTRTDAETLADLPMIGWNLPFHFLFTEPRTPGFSGSVEVMPYIGILPLICAVIAIVTSRKRSLVKLCLGIFVISLLLAAAPKWLQPLLFRLPLYTAFGSPSRWLFLGKLALLPLIALGFDTLLRGIPKAYQQSIALLCLSPIVLLQLCRIVFPLEVVPVLETWNLDLVTNNISIAVALLIGIILLAPVWQSIQRIRPKMLCALGAFTLFVAYLPLLRDWTTPRKHLVLPIITHDSTETYVQILSPLMSIKYREQLFQPGVLISSIRPLLTNISSILLQPNQNIFLKLSKAEIYEPLFGKRASFLLGALGIETFRIPKEYSLVQNSLPLEEKIALFKKRRYLLDALSISDIFSTYVLNDMYLLEVANAPIVGEMFGEANYGDFHKTIYIPMINYANPSVRPPVFLAPSIEFMEPDSDRIYKYLLSEQWPSDRTFVECYGCTGTFVATQSGSITILNRSPTELLLQSASSGQQWLVVSQSYLPGWKVTIDDEELTPALAQSIFFAIPLPSGNHTVKFRFSYPTLLRDSIALLWAPEKAVWLQ